jgi:hypothetical protein
MIVVHINPTGVEEVYFKSSSDLAEDLCMAVWPMVRHELGALDRKLKRATGEVIKSIGGEVSDE